MPTSEKTMIGDRWEVQTKRRIGDGGFGAVYRAKDTSKEPSVDSAAKKVPVVSPAEREAYFAELEVLGKVCDHDSIIGLQGNHEEGDDGWMFMEMATGGELFDRLIDSGNLSEKAAWPYAYALVQALKHCMNKGVVHRDLKLENVMLCAEDPYQIRLIDFGLAVQVRVNEDGSLADGSELRDSAGTQAYRAPEVCSAGYDPLKVDVWALGITLFSLCAGFFPLQEAKVDDWRFKRLAGDQHKGVGSCDSIFRMYKRQCPFTDSFRELLDGMLKIDPVKRLSIQEVADSAWIKTAPASHDEESAGPRYRSLSGGADDFDMGPPVLDTEMVPITRQRVLRP